MKQPIAWFLAFSASVGLASAFTACGGDDSTPGTGGSGGSGGSSTGTAGSGGTTGKGGSAGTAGSAGTGGSAGTAGAGGGTTDSGTDAGPITIICGNKVCAEIDLGLGAPLPPCCPMGEMNACGASLMGVLCLTTTPGTPDPNCPDVTVPGGPAAPGCCSVTGVCGGDFGAPLGCNDLSGILGGTPTPCGPDAAPPPPRDAGSDTTQPPPDTGTGTDSSGGDTGGSDTGSRGDAPSGDAPPSDGGGSDGRATDASGDRAG